MAPIATEQAGVRQPGSLNLGPRLVAIGAAKSCEYGLRARSVTIGSHGANDLVLSESTVSARQAAIQRRLARYRLVDLNSTNGTFLNGRRITRPETIRHGDELTFGSARFVFIDPASQRRHRRLIEVRAALAAILILFVVGFGLAEHFLNVGLREKLSRASMDQTGVKQQLSKATAAAEQADWLRRANYYRAMVKFAPVTENSAMSDADFKHARYLVKYVLRSHHEFYGATVHAEDPSDPWYTPEGSAAAATSDVAPPCAGCWLFSDQQEIDTWMTGPFHRLAILNPALEQAGYANYNEGGLSASALDVPVTPDRPHPLSDPIEFPPDGAEIPLSALQPGEWPDPLASCPGYSAPAGLPITLQLGAWIATPVSSHSLTANGAALEHCVFDGSSYTNPDSTAQSRARQTLKGFGAVVLIPKTPLTSRSLYTVSITARNKTYHWSFKVK